MNGIDVLVIAALIVIVLQIAINFDERERWNARQELREEAWRKINDL